MPEGIHTVTVTANGWVVKCSGVTDVCRSWAECARCMRKTPHSLLQAFDVYEMGVAHGKRHIDWGSTIYMETSKCIIESRGGCVEESISEAVRELGWVVGVYEFAVDVQDYDSVDWDFNGIRVNLARVNN